MNANTKAYFQKSVIRYSRQDVIELLKKKLDCAGPLLEVVVNGIDNLGGICFGFTNLQGKGNSRDRSIEFMDKNMNISRYLAEYIYVSIRCGIAHQGMPKIGLKFFIEYERLEKGKIFYIYNDDYIYLNVVELAYAYIETIDRINADLENNIKYYPISKPIDKILFDKAKNEVKDTLDSILGKVNERDKSQSKGKYEGLPLNCSYSAYSPNDILSNDSP